MFGKSKQPPIRSLIGAGTHITGDVMFRDGLRVDGEVSGRLLADATGSTLLVISETAQIRGEVHAGHVIINGQVHGPVAATQLLELQPKARIHGEVTYAALEMHQGATIDGTLHPMADGESHKPALKLAANNP